MDLCGPMHVESINGKRYVLVVVDDYSLDTWVFFLHSKDEALDVIISFIKKTQVNLQLQVQRVRTDNGTEFKNKTLVKFFDENRNRKGKVAEWLRAKEWEQEVLGSIPIAGSFALFLDMGKMMGVVCEVVEWGRKWGRGGKSAGGKTGC
nr:retrovirus-related Pol polyprotein from transposon TNT 1-94 [Tanacetum cinerariifolium]